MEFKNLDEYKSYKELKDKHLSLKDLMSVKRVKDYNSNVDLSGQNFGYNYSTKMVDDEIIKKLLELSKEAGVFEKYKALLSGFMINTGEKRKVLHHLTRGNVLGAPVIEDGKNLGDFYENEKQKVFDFVPKIHSGQIVSSSGKKYTNVVQIGIGGSDLGPRAMYISLAGLYKSHMHAGFISNVDPDDANLVLSSTPADSTLFILVSKSGTTQETLANEILVTKYLENAGVKNPKKNIVCVTSQTSPLAKSSDYLTSFFIDDYIGGRFSSTSCVGTVILGLCYGNEVVKDFLTGAHLMDKSALEEDISKNPALISALIGLYERNILGFPYTTVLPYSQSLLRFTAHLQQMDMESNGKSVNRDGKKVDYKTGVVVFGEPGTNGQHSFYQLLHQGTDIIPLEFVGFEKNQTGFDVDVQGSTSNEKLKANLLAQIFAFALGSPNSDLNKNFTGQRPSSLVYGKQLTARFLGALLAYFENKVMFQGFLWNLNSFDQEGVQLGKVLTKKILESPDTLDDFVKEYKKYLGM